MIDFICKNFLSIAALLVAIYIPRKIMINQIYADLLASYRTPEMGAAVLSIFHFFKYDCKENINNIEDEYIKKYNEQIDRKLKKKTNKKWQRARLCKNVILSKIENNIDYSQTLHFQRRLVAQFYFNMASLRYDFRLVRLPKKYMEIWFRLGDKKLLSIILHMAKAAEKIAIEIGTVPYPPEDETPMNQMIYKLYEEVSECV